MLTSQTAGEIVILVVDDEVVVRNMIQRVLRREGFAVLSAADGQEALLVFRKFPETVHMLITDIEMPGLNGFALAAQIRLEKPQTKILFISGRLTAAETDPAHFLAKPFKPRTLVDSVIETLGELLPLVGGPLASGITDRKSTV